MHSYIEHGRLVLKIPNCNIHGLWVRFQVSMVGWVFDFHYTCINYIHYFSIIMLILRSVIRLINHHCFVNSPPHPLELVTSPGMFLWILIDWSISMAMMQLFKSSSSIRIFRRNIHLKIFSTPEHLEKHIWWIILSMWSSTKILNYMATGSGVGVLCFIKWNCIQCMKSFLSTPRHLANKLAA